MSGKIIVCFDHCNCFCSAYCSHHCSRVLLMSLFTDTICGIVHSTVHPFFLFSSAIIVSILP